MENIPFFETLVTYHLSAVFFGALIIGQAAIFTASMLAGQGAFSIFTVFIMCLAAATVSDIVWFVVGSRTSAFIDRFRRFNTAREAVLEKIQRLIGGKPFLVLLVTKFVYGTRIPGIIYVSMHRVPFSRFMAFTTVGNTIWLSVLVSIGYLVGKGIVKVAPDTHPLYVFATAIAVLLIAGRLIALWIRKSRI